MCRIFSYTWFILGALWKLFVCERNSLLKCNIIEVMVLWKKRRHITSVLCNLEVIQERNGFNLSSYWRVYNIQFVNNMGKGNITYYIRLVMHNRLINLCHATFVRIWLMLHKFTSFPFIRENPKKKKENKIQSWILKV